MKYEFGFLGCGNMGGALALAVSKKVGGGKCLGADHFAEKVQAISAQTGLIAGTSAQVAEQCRYIFLGIKPQYIEGALAEISGILAARTDRFVLVSMVAGMAIESIQRMAGGDYPVIRIMPNTPAAVGQGMTLYCPNALVTAEEEQAFVEAMAMSGKVDRLPENLINAASALSGCGPAFVYLFIEALADAGVECGLPRDKALLYAKQTVIGSGVYAQESGKHPCELKDAVCSPGGTTIAGVHALHDGGFQSAVMNAVRTAFDKTNGLGK